VSEYDFDLHFRLTAPDEDPESHLGRLLEEECDDSTVGVGRRGHIWLGFGRDAASASEAIFSAIAAVQRAVPGARLLVVGPDLVGLTDVGELLGCSRQNVRQLVFDGEPDPPIAVYSGHTNLWHLADLLTWLREKKRYPVSDELLDLAEVNRQVNLFVESRHIQPAVQDEIRAVLAEDRLLREVSAR